MRRLAGSRPLKRRPEPGNLGVAADQHRAGDPLPHTANHPKNDHRIDPGMVARGHYTGRPDTEIP
jgi:hypothetical protein